MSTTNPGANLLSCCMIVRDNAPTLVPCLESIRPWVDDLVVVDTGSTDETPQIARRFGARVFHFPWVDDFSAARNESLRHALGAWLFWMDSDDTISAENGRKLRELAYSAHLLNTGGYIMQVHCPAQLASHAADMTAVDHVKMFRNHPQIRFEGRIHEQVLMPIYRLGATVLWTDIFVVHSGADHSPAGRMKKFERDLRILRLDLAERPDHPFVLFNLGMTFSELQEHAEAADYLTRSLALANPAESHVRKAYSLLVNSLVELGRVKDAENACRKGREFYPLDAELCFREGRLAHQSMRLADAERAFLSALRNKGDRYLSSFDRGIVGYKARHNLADVYADMGRHDLAEIQWRHALDEVPQYALGRRSLVESMLRQGKHVSAEVEIDCSMRDSALRCVGLQLRADVAMLRRDLAGARRLLETAVQDYPDDEDVHDGLCKFLFYHGQPAEAERACQELIRRQPHNGSAHHNLGNVYLRCDRVMDAINSFRESLRLRPKHSQTLRQLGLALQAAGGHREAQAAFLEADHLGAKISR